MSLFEEVKRVREERQADYDDPRPNMERIAEVWTSLLRAAHILPDDISLKASDVVNLMIGLKLVRQAYKHKEDNLVDIIGYTDIADIVNCE